MAIYKKGEINMQKRGLGRGLSALIPDTTSVFVGGRTIVNIDINKILPNPRQPRMDFNQESLEELSDSIKTQGIVQPILVRPRDGKYELVAGERRWRASRKAGLTLIPAIIKDYSNQESLELALVENLQREDLNTMDEADAYQKFMKEFHLTQADVAKKVGKNRSTVANTMRLLELPKEIQNSIRKGQLSAGHARPIIALTSDEDRLALWKEIMNNNLTVRDVEQIVHGSGSNAKTSRKKKAATKNEELSDLTELLTSHLGTKVRIIGSAKQGKIEIDYYSQEDLERIIESLTGNIT
jgi:ParB family transcriptional regulator, chromosome partitioning protein